MRTYLDEPRKAFGIANGWTYRTTSFNLGQLVRNSSRKTKDEFWNPHDYWHDGFDHSEYYWLDKKPIAIVTHPYSGAHERLRPVTEEWKLLRLHECPDKRASWYYPDRTLLFVVTRRNTHVVWPTPEEIERAIEGHFLQLQSERRENLKVRTF
jgi:hypothetical protein